MTTLLAGLLVFTVIHFKTVEQVYAGSKKSVAKSKISTKASPRKSKIRAKKSQIDYQGFKKAVTKLEEYRKERLITDEEFIKMSKEKNTIILDTRSKAGFDDIHIKGAIHLNFSDFTAEKLAKVIPNKSTRILIYCNNNFIGERRFQGKGAALALNIPTFIHLVEYGYKNVYELSYQDYLENTKIEFSIKD